MGDNVLRKNADAIRQFDEKLKNKIVAALKSMGSFRHVPDVIFEVKDIPYTLSGKKMEVPVKKVLLGLSHSTGINKEAAKNPTALEYFESIREEFMNKYLK